MPEKIEKLVPDLEFFCVEVSGLRINTLIERYNKYLEVFNSRKSATNRTDRYTPKEEKEALEYLNDIRIRLSDMITKTKSSDNKTSAKNIQESTDNYNTYMLIMSSNTDKMKLFNSSTVIEDIPEQASGSVRSLVNQYEKRIAPKPVINKKDEKTLELEKEISDAEKKIAEELTKIQIRRDEELAQQLSKPKYFKGLGLTKLTAALTPSSATNRIGAPVLYPESRAAAIRTVVRAKGRMLDEDTIITLARELPLKQPNKRNNVFAARMTELLNKFTKTETDPLFDFFSKNNVTEPKLSEAPVPGKDYFSTALKALEKHSIKLGGSPVFGKSKPSIEDKDSDRFMFGVPVAAVKDWIRMTIAQEWTPRLFWKNIGKKFDISDKQMSKYEEAHLCIQRFGLLIANKERFIEMLDKKDTERYIELSQITGLAWHPYKNSAGVEKEYIAFIEQFLTTYFKRAQEEGPEALQEYFESFRGVCFEDRTRNLLEYAMKHPLEENATPIPADWDTSGPAEDAFMKEVQVLGIEIQDLPTPNQLYQHLQQKGMFDLEFITKDGTKAKPTKEDYDKWAQEMVEACVLNEPNDSPSMTRN